MTHLFLACYNTRTYYLSSELTQTLGNPEVVFTYSLQERVSYMSIQTLQIAYHAINILNAIFQVLQTRIKLLKIKVLVGKQNNKDHDILVKKNHSKLRDTSMYSKCLHSHTMHNARIKILKIYGN